MGEKMRRLVAQNRLLEATSIIELDFDACAFVLSDADYTQISASGVNVDLAIARIVINQAVNAAYPEGLNRREGQLWAGWQEVLSASEPRFSITHGQVEWLAAILARDELKLPAGMAQWREVLIEYLERLKSYTQAIGSDGAQSDVAKGLLG
jgi:hypothetical protein